jgi:CheY-like chemotaxis protein
MKVLIVDDDLSTRCILTEILEVEDFEALAASDGPSALSLAEKWRDLDAILMDYHMPGMDGVACLEKIKAMGHFNHAKMFLMSAEWAAQTLADHLGVEFIRKPFNITELLSRLRGPPPGQLQLMAM